MPLPAIANGLVLGCQSKVPSPVVTTFAPYICHFAQWAMCARYLSFLEEFRPRLKKVKLRSEKNELYLFVATMRLSGRNLYTAKEEIAKEIEENSGPGFWGHLPTGPRNLIGYSITKGSLMIRKIPRIFI